MRPRSQGYHAGRALFVGFLLLLAWSVMITRIVSLHLDATRRAKVLSSRNYRTALAASRGWIFDRTGKPMALDVTLKNVCVDPARILSEGVARPVSAHLARLLGQKPADVYSAITNRATRRYAAIAKQRPEADAAAIARLRLPGVFSEDVSVRQYPMGTLGCHVFGFVNAEGVGSSGLEQRYDDLLRGLPGLLLGEKDGRRREILTRRSLDAAPVPGANIHLTLDATIQYYVEKALDEAMVHTNFNPEAVWAVVEDVRTGEILAMASRPAYDLNAYATSTPEQRRNRAIAANIEPGSIFKTATVAAALDAGVIETGQVFFCENGYWRDCPGRPLKDFHAYGDLDVGGVLKKSSNIGAAKIAILLGPERFRRYLADFGIGRPTGIELPGEEAGILHPLSAWTSPSISRVAMGHEVMVTALQMVNLLSCIGNDGYLMQPHIVSRIEDPSGRVLFQNAPRVLRRPITERTAAQMRALLRGVTRPDGTGKQAAIEGYPVAGKTGTAEKLVNGHYVRNSNVASFMGMFPADSPRIAIIVVADDPHPYHGGGAVSAPIFARIAAPVARYLDIPPVDASDVIYYTPDGLPVPDDA